MIGWHLAIKWGNLDILQKVWECTEGKLTAEEINKLLLATDSDGRTSWYWEAVEDNLDILQIVWGWAEEKLTAEEISKLLLATDSEGRTGWHLAAVGGQFRHIRRSNVLGCR